MGARRPAVGPVADRLAIVLLCVLVQTPGLLHWIDSDPLLLLSPLRVGGRNGLLPGYPGWIDPNIGTTTAALGHLAAAQWLAGQVPWWNPYSGIGVPLAAEMQPAALFLPFVLLLHFHDGLLWLRAAIGAVAGLGAYQLARALGLRRAACLAAGLLFAFDGTLAWLAHGPDRAAAFLPWLLVGVERARARAAEQRPLGWIVLGLALAWSLYAGFPETAYLDGLFVALWALWRLARPAEAATWGVRIRLLGKLASGVAVGLLLAAPLVWPFADYLGRSDTGLHGAGFAHAALVADAFPMFLIPYLYGPIGALGYTPSGPTWFAWGTIGGYVGAAAAVLALLGLTGLRARDGVLRAVLGCWIALSLAKTASLPGVTAAVNLLPLMPQTAFFRYAEPSWSLAAIVLAAFAIDDWQRGRLASWRPALAATAALLLLAVALRLGWSTMRLLACHPGYPAFAACMVAWCGLLAVLLPALLAGSVAGRPVGRLRTAAVVALVGLDAIGMFALPLLASPRGARVDRAPLDFLQAHLGLQRFYSLGVIPPNYGARFGLASINDDMVPVPRNWADQVRTALDRLAVPTTFTGSFLGRPQGPDPRAALLQHLDAYRALGVRYVITLRGADSFSTDLSTADVAQPGRALGLPPGASARGHLPAGFAQGRRIDGVAVQIGTYVGLADGALSAALCTPTACAAGSTGLQGAPDNEPLHIRLSPPLQTAPGDVLRFTLTHAGGRYPVAVWLLPASAARLDTPAPKAAHPDPAAGPALFLSADWPGSVLALAFRDRLADIFEIPGAAPYFSADPPCSLAVMGRRALLADCPVPAILTRRELAFPGWRASIDGRAARLGQDGIVQTLALPRGRTQVRFSYAPPFVGVAYAAALMGLAWVLLAVAGAGGLFQRRRPP